MTKYGAAIHPGAFRDETEDQSGGSSSSP